MTLQDLQQYLQGLPVPARRVPVLLQSGSRTIPSHPEVVQRLRGSLSPLPNEVGGNGAAVLLLLYPLDGETMVLMTRRSASLRNHPHEISFPGGGVEAGETIPEAALRETFEEVGIDYSAIELLGLLGSGAIRGNGRSFSGVVGHCRSRPVVQLNADEVETVLEVPLSLVYTPDYFCELWYSDTFGWGLFHFFVMAPDLIWGASARMLVDLLVLLE
ncbi:CoA pyrophosphatase [Ferrimicrobium sp.]|uniref:NUDIX hydrolase n=1 Tax=Ferrimicrobium sp. TaxID=2926050 RepID=UPI00260355DC|nr:CoA pyrophosphatase [Ferrimicrobium sp.]